MTLAQLITYLNNLVSLRSRINASLLNVGNELDRMYAMSVPTVPHTRLEQLREAIREARKFLDQL